MPFACVISRGARADDEASSTTSAMPLVNVFLSKARHLWMSIQNTNNVTVLRLSGTNVLPTARSLTQAAKAAIARIEERSTTVPA